MKLLSIVFFIILALPSWSQTTDSQVETLLQEQEEIILDQGPGETFEEQAAYEEVLKWEEKEEEDI